MSEELRASKAREDAIPRFLRYYGSKKVFEGLEPETVEAIVTGLKRAIMRRIKEAVSEGQLSMTYTIGGDWQGVRVTEKLMHWLGDLGYTALVTQNVTRCGAFYLDITVDWIIDHSDLVNEPVGQLPSFSQEDIDKIMNLYGVRHGQ